jgi:HAD superfamily hydrolase (TIGR01509 family)
MKREMASSVSSPTPLPSRGATRAVIFDLDGVLVWSVPMHWHAFRKTFEAEGRRFPLEEYMKLAVGASREDVLRTVLGDLPEGKLLHLMAEKEKHARAYLQENGMTPIAASMDFVRAVRARQLKTAVATASRTPELFLESVGAASLFDLIVGRQHVKHPKPHPDIYLLAADLLGVPPVECLVVEDSPIGIDAALAAGMRVLALTTTADARALSRATGVCKSLADVRLEEWVS